MDKSDQRVPVLCSKRGLTNPACPEALVRLFTDLPGPGEDKRSGGSRFPARPLEERRGRTTGLPAASALAANRPALPGASGQGARGISPRVTVRQVPRGTRCPPSFSGRVLRGACGGRCSGRQRWCEGTAPPATPQGRSRSPPRFSP